MKSRTGVKTLAQNIDEIQEDYWSEEMSEIEKVETDTAESEIELKAKLGGDFDFMNVK